jgi:hypothetical protein
MSQGMLNRHQLSLCLLWNIPKFLERRPGFPTWTWLGWNGSSLECETFHHDNRYEVRDECLPNYQAEYEDLQKPKVMMGEHLEAQHLLDWETESSLILQRNDKGHNPRFLHITAFAFTFPCTRPDTASTWHINMPHFPDHQDNKGRLRAHIRSNLDQLH